MAFGDKAAAAARASIIAAALAAMAPAAAAEAAESSPLTCFSTVFEPYVVQLDGRLVGVDVDAVIEIGRRLDLPVRIDLMPWRRLEEAVKVGLVTCAFAYFRTPDRGPYMDFMTLPLHVTDYVLFTPAASKLHSSKVPDLFGAIIAVNRGFKTPPDFAAAVQDGLVTAHQVPEEAESFEMLSRGRVDAVLTNRVVGGYVSHRLGLKALRVIEPPLSTEPAFLAFSKAAGKADLAARFDDALRQIIADGTYRKIQDSWSVPAKAR